MPPLKPSEERHPSFSLPSVWWLLAVLGVPWLVDASFQPPPPSSPGFSPVLLCLCPFSSYKDTSRMEFRAHTNPV